MGTTRRTANLTLAAALGLGSIIGLASTAAAETPEHTDQMVLVLPGDTDPQGPSDDKAPIPQDDPEPEPEDDKAPVPQDDPEPEPLPDGPDEIEQPTGHGDPECDPKLASCDITDVPEDDGCNPILASCDLTSDPGDPDDGDDGGDDTPAPEVEGSTEERDALPRTGTGLEILGAAGAGLTGLGVALRRLARR